MNQKFLLILALIIFFLASIGLTWYIATKWKISADVTNTSGTKIETETIATTNVSEPGATSKSVSPATISLILQPGYNIKTIPYYLSPSDGKNVFSQLKSKEVFSLINNEWVSLLESGSITPGQGFAIKSEDGEVYKPPVTTAKVDEASLFSIRLKMGWNAIGNPFTFDIQWNPIVKASKGNTTLDKAIEASVLTPAQRYSPAGKNYQDVATNDVWRVNEGILIKSGGEIDLLIDPTLKP